MSTNKKANPYGTSWEDASAYWNADILWIMLATGDDTGGQYSLIEQLCPPEPLPPPDEQKVKEIEEKYGMKRVSQPTSGMQSDGQK